jgi:hypothetical protein
MSGEKNSFGDIYICLEKDIFDIVAALTPLFCCNRQVRKEPRSLFWMSYIPDICGSLRLKDSQIGRFGDLRDLLCIFPESQISLCHRMHFFVAPTLQQPGYVWMLDTAARVEGLSGIRNLLRSGTYVMTRRISSQMGLLSTPYPPVNDEMIYKYKVYRPFQLAGILGSC